jgi:hypothetical protein
LTIIIVVASLKITAFGFAPTPQGKLSLAWDRSTDSSVVGYRLYLGSASQVYTNVTDVGDQARITIVNLIPGTTYYFAVTAYDDTGLESEFSGEVGYTVPASAALPSASLLSWCLQKSTLGQATIIGTGKAGWIYEVWATKDLLSWSVVGTVVADAGGSFEFTDRDSFMLPFRFYRLHQRPNEPSSQNQLPAIPASSVTRIKDF